MGQSPGVSNRTTTDKYWSVILLWCSLIVAITIIASAASKTFSPDQLIYLAQSLSKGFLYVDEMPLVYPDYVVFNGHVYLPPGPLSAIVLIPFLPLIDIGLRPAWISVLFSIINVALLYLVLRIVINEEGVRLWTLLLFFGGTVYLGVATTMISWNFAHILGTTCILVALVLALSGKKLPLLVGLFIGLAAATRLTYCLALFFFIWYWLNSKNYSIAGPGLRPGLNKVAWLIGGFCVPVLFLLYYNYARFGSVLETGYGLAVVGSRNLEVARNHGLFSLTHIPQNLRYFLFQGPTTGFSIRGSSVYGVHYLQPSPLGMSIIITSPAILWVFKNRLDNVLIQSCWVGILAMVVPMLLYYGTGWVQFGYRYSLDFMPFIVILAAQGFHSSKSGYWRLFIVLSVIVNLWGTSWLHSWV